MSNALEDADGVPGPTLASPGAFARAGAALAASSILANLLGWAFAVVLSRALGPGSYGALAALLAMGLIGSIPAISLQLLVARDLAGRETGSEGWLRASVVMGFGLTLLFVVLAPFARGYLDLPGPFPVIWTGLALWPTTVLGALQGILLGRKRFGGLAASYLLLAGLRFAGGCVAAAAEASVSGALAAATLGSLLACAVTAAIVARGERLRWTTGDDRRAVPRVRDRANAMAAAASATAAILVLTNLDVILARHFLPSTASGQYGVGALFAKAAFWAPHFLAVLAFPLLANRHSRRRSFALSTAVTLAIGGVVILGAALLATPVVQMTVGAAYLDGAALAPEFAILGVLAALLQLLLFAGLARRTRRAEAVVWAGIGAELLIVSMWMHGSSYQIVTTSICVCAVLSAVVLGDELRIRGQEPPTDVVVPAAG